MILILGYGNPMRGDDALGQIAVEFLAERFGEHDGVHVRAVHQLTPDLSEMLAGYESAVLIDARHAAPAGQVFVEEVRAAERLPSGAFSHYVTPGELLLLADALYGKRPCVYLAGITATEFEVGEPLSAAVREALPVLYETIEALVMPDFGFPMWGSLKGL
ncbi:MAG: hydrogenase maturation protease [Candidatus Promineifilaceae bacterium]